MPVIKSGDKPPVWCEMTHFDIVQLAPGERHTFARAGKKERLFVCEGQCRINHNGATVDAQRGAKLDLTGEAGQFEVAEVTADTTLVRVCGHWGEKLGGSGLFSVSKSDNPQDKGDPVSYRKETNFDCHYHDYDEYWILYKGRGVAVSEGKHYPVQAGECIATGMGHHHDFPLVEERVEAVFFETTVGGQGRKGHLWNHTHGPAQPQWERV
jgi:mannose-6-phosphate isomerase-like protein (cupin superfamily)